MIISQSKINLASLREYSRSRSKSVLNSEKSNGFLTSLSEFKCGSEYSENEKHYSNSQNEGTDSFSCTMNLTMKYFNQNTYTRNGLLSDYTSDSKRKLNESSIDNNNDSDNVKKTDNVSNTSKTSGIHDVWDMQNEIQRRTLQVLFNLIKMLRFRAGFEGNYECNNYRNSDFNYDQNLSITNSSNYSVISVTNSYSETYEEYESTSFSGCGTAVTADGRSIDFNIELNISRSYMEQNSLTYINKYPRILTDPLIINLNGNPVYIEDQSFKFDLNSDGTDEDISYLSDNSGYLVYDRNNDGIINDGSEMFGTASGDGFSDLSAYDSDNNGWIDEADDIYKSLKIWKHQKDGKDILLSLKEADVGAIYLGNTSTEFSLKDSDQNLNGQIRKTGIYFHENGTAGTIQQADF